MTTLSAPTCGTCGAQMGVGGAAAGGERPRLVFFSCVLCGAQTAVTVPPKVDSDVRQTLEFAADVVGEYLSGVYDPDLHRVRAAKLAWQVDQLLERAR